MKKRVKPRIPSRERNLIRIRRNLGETNIHAKVCDWESGRRCHFYAFLIIDSVLGFEIGNNLINELLKVFKN